MLATVVAGSFLLGGCMKMEMGVDIKSDDDIRVAMMVGIQRSAAAAMAESGEEITPEDLCDQAGSDSGVTDATVNDVSDDNYIACEMSGTTDLASMGDALQHADGKYTFTMTSSDADSNAGLGADVFDSFRIAVTFPGEVQEHNGSSTVDGTTVTWTDPNDLYGSEGLRAVGKDKASSVMLWIMLAGIVVLVLAAVAVLLLVLRTRRGTGAAPMQPYLPPTDPHPGPPQPGQPEEPRAVQPGEQPPPTADPR